MSENTPRRRPRESEMTPEQRAAIQEVLARKRTPEARAESASVRAAVEKEFPPLAADPGLLELLAMLRAERERQELSLTDVSERTGMDRSMISRLELGKIPNPTLATLKAYASALGFSLDWTVRPEIAVSGHGAPYIMVDPYEGPAIAEFLRSRNVGCIINGGVAEGVGGSAGATLSVIAMEQGTDVKRVKRLLRHWRTEGAVRRLRRALPRRTRIDKPSGL